MENEVGPGIRSGAGRGGHKARSTEAVRGDLTVKGRREAKEDERALNTAECVRTYLPDLG